MATEKQVSYLLCLLRKNGYSTEWMDASFKRLGARMRERSGSVEDWLKSLNVGTASSLIDDLKKSA